MRIVNLLPKVKKLYSLCKAYCNRIDGENNDDIKTNGELNVLKLQIKDCSVVFDVGANIGEWTKLVLKYNPDIDIHCFEPIKANYQKLLLNKFTGNVNCNNSGISSKVGHCKIYREVQSLYQRSGLKAGWGIGKLDKIEKIKLDTIDHYCKIYNIKSIDLLKMDIEGHEFAALQGAERMIGSEKIKRIQFEYGGCNIDSKVLLKDFFELFNNKKYIFYKIMPKRLIKIPEYDQRLENFAYKNFVILHKSVAV